MNDVLSEVKKIQHEQGCEIKAIDKRVTVLETGRDGCQVVFERIQKTLDKLEERSQNNGKQILQWMMQVIIFVICNIFLLKYLK